MMINTLIMHLSMSSPRVGGGGGKIELSQALCLYLNCAWVLGPLSVSPCIKLLIIPGKNSVISFCYLGRRKKRSTHAWNSRFLLSVQAGDLIPQIMHESSLKNGSVVFARFATKSFPMTSLEGT